MTAPMTLAEWRALSIQARLLAWQGWTVEQRRDMADQFVAQTPDWSLRYPDDYGQPADSPVAIGQLALDVDAALTWGYTNSRPLVVPWTGMTKASDKALTADVINEIAFDTFTPQPIHTTAAVSIAGVSGHHEFTVLETGLYTIAIAADVRHATVGTVRSLEVGINMGGAHDYGVNTIHQATAGAGDRARWASSRNFTAGDKFTMYVKTVGAAATGWTMIYALGTIEGV